ncbi:MAG: molybdate ABC transporter substrate-binding protein [Syntrophus sp. (in: bacteria)]|nr:molybdate ABC transporter substrate-binding protein [Syntrophus sp. (in: bacteria)]
MRTLTGGFMRRITILLVIILIVFSFVSEQAYAAGTDELMVFCGAAFKRPIEDVVELFQTKTGIKVNMVYAGIGTLFSQMLFTKQGDIFIAPSPDIMEKATTKGLLIKSSVKNLGYVVPCINIIKSNPKNIKTLKDLARPGLKIAIGNPELVYIGALAVELIEKNLTMEEKNSFRANIVTFAEDFNKLSTYLVFRQVDAIIGFHYLEGWYPDKVETIKLKPDQIQRIGSGQIGILNNSNKKELSQKFVDFVTSDEAKKIFHKYKYFGSPDEAFLWIGDKKPVGGEYLIPKDWIKK